MASKKQVDDEGAVQTDFDTCNFKGCKYKYKRYGLNVDIKDLRAHKRIHEAELKQLFAEDKDDGSPDQ